MFLRTAHILPRECPGETRIQDVMGYVLLFFQMFVRRKQMINFASILQFVTVEIHMSNLIEKKLVTSL